MNLSLLLIIVMVLVVIPLLIRAVMIKSFIKSARITEMPETKREAINKNPSFEMAIVSSMLLPLSETVPVTERTIQQKELFGEKIVYITASQPHFFRGYSLLQSLQNAGFTYGKKGLFEYIDHEDILCSVSPIIAPYVFNMTEIGALATKALKLQINPDIDEQLAGSIIQRLAEELGGEVKDVPE